MNALAAGCARDRDAGGLRLPDRRDHHAPRRRDRRKGVLMLVMAAVLVGNVLVWTL